MYQKIMVPLDGSKLAECVLPYVEELAKGCSTEEVILVSVTERIVGYKPSPEPQRVDSLGQLMTGGETSLTPEPVGKLPVAVGKMARQAHRYLGRIMKR